jgi:hypothetical protein
MEQVLFDDLECYPEVLLLLEVEALHGSAGCLRLEVLLFDRQ